MDWKQIKAFCLDISGVLKNSDGFGNDVPIDGSVAAVNMLIANKIPFRLLTNESQVTLSELHEKLTKIGFVVDANHMITPLVTVYNILKKQNLRPYLLLHTDVLPMFSEVKTDSPNAVVIGDATENFTYSNLNTAFQILHSMKEKKFYTLGKGRFYQQGKDELVLDVGPFTVALEYASGGEAEIVGKPSSTFFNSALESLDLPAKNVVMVGDDILSDVGGSQKAGMKGIQVRTGKYRSSDEPHPTVKPDLYVDNLKQAIDLFMASRTT